MPLVAFENERRSSVGGADGGAAREVLDGPEGFRAAGGADAVRDEERADHGVDLGGLEVGHEALAAPRRQGAQRGVVEGLRIHRGGGAESRGQPK